MLSAANNELITRVGPGTAMGELFRRYWLPAVIGAELIAAGSPVRLRILCEDLLAFRNSDGVVGIIEPYCAHKLAPLYFGRNALYLPRLEVRCEWPLRGYAKPAC